MARFVVLYGTREGQTRKTAARIADVSSRDDEHTDWPRVDQFASEFADSVDAHVASDAHSHAAAE